MLTKKGKYGLKALAHLARLPVGQLAFVGDIATRNIIPKKFLDAILVELRNAGFVQSRKGKEGGYLWRGRRMKSRSATSCACSTGRLPPFPAPAAPGISAVKTATRRHAKCDI